MIWNGVSTELIKLPNGYQYYRPLWNIVVFHKPFVDVDGCTRYSIVIGGIDENEPKSLNLTFNEYLNQMTFTF
jgi:hypothetical protein